MAKEAKQEAIKRAKDGLDVWDDIQRYAKTGFDSIDKDDFERFKWYGLYQQKPKEGGHFMIRIKIPGGRLNTAKLRAIGELAQKYARNVADISTRQDIQLHWLTIEDVPDIFDTIYNKLGMYQEYSCGDAPRNVTSCPLAGIADDEIVDCSEIAPAVSDMYKALGKEVSNLPRKFKTSLAGCAIHCHKPQINCLAFFGVQREHDGTVENGLGVMVGGGLRNTPHYGQSLRVFVPPDVDLIKDIARNVAGIFRDSDELRQGRLKARFKFKVAAAGWEAIRDELEKRLGRTLERDDSIIFPQNVSHGDHLGIGRQKDGLSYVGIPIPRGRLSGDQLVRIAELGEQYAANGNARFATTIKQNLIMLNIDPGKVSDLTAALAGIDLPTDAPQLRASLISCTGIEFCNLAVSETKQRAKEVLDYLEANLDLDEHLYIAISGCPNSCAQYQTADIGLHGVPTKYKGEKVEGFHFNVGGRLGNDPVFGREIEGADGTKVKVPSPIIHEAIERLVKAYQADSSGEGFANWARAQEMDRLASILLPEGACE